MSTKQVTIKFEVPQDKTKHIFNARDELAKAGITFDTGGYKKENTTVLDWEFDWSLKGNVEVIPTTSRSGKKN